MLNENILNKTENKVNIEEPVKHNKKEVFHISNQDYTYDQAKCKCRAYEGRLATHSEIIDAYNNGADWCSYGWSDGQTAYYPTQPCTYNKLQRGYTRKNPNNECGLPGVNGGFWDNPYMKFGINCYGIKPQGAISKIQRKTCSDERPFCEKSANYNASHKMTTDVISSFNNNTWSIHN